MLDGAEHNKSLFARKCCPVITAFKSSFLKILIALQIIVLPFFIVLELVMNRHWISKVRIDLLVELVDWQAILEVEAERE